MESSKNSRFNGKLLKEQQQQGPPGPVAFQGIGTRLRRSRSKDHSNEFDNLSTTAALEIASLKHQNRGNVYDQQQQQHAFGYLTKGGTLERPKRLYSFSNSSESSSFIQNNANAIYGSRSNSRNNNNNVLYDESRLLGHQYEEPHLVLDHLGKDPLYDVNPRRRSKDLLSKYLTGSRVPPLPADYASDLYHSYAALDGPPTRPNTTVIPPSKLFSKNFTSTTSSSPYNAQPNNRLDCGSAKDSALGSEFHSPKSQASSSLSSKQQQQQISSITGSNVIRTPKDLSESDSSTKGDSGLLLTRTSHEMSSSSSSSTGGAPDHHHLAATLQRSNDNHVDHHGIMSSDRTFPDLNDTENGDSPPTKLCLTSSSHSSVMHTYANPFQNGGCGGSTFSEDTTGPIIPDMNTLRPSQLLKSSFAGSGPPPSLHSSSSANHRNVISYLANRLWSQIGGAEQNPKGDLSEHRCSWRVSTFTLIVLVCILFVVIITMSAMNTGSAPSSVAGSGNPKVPCIVVEDIDSSSTSLHLSSSGDSQYSASQLSPDLSSANCPLSLPRDPLHFKEFRLAESGLTPFSFRLAPYSAWTVWFSQLEASFVNFQFYAPMHARLVLFAQKDEPPTLSIHQIFQIVSEGALSRNQQRVQRRTTVRDSSQLLQLETTHYFEQGSWYITVVNDLEQTLPLVVNMSTVNNVTSHCPSNCHNNGHCHLGNCQCFPGFIGHDCADNVCPVFCAGHGQYLQGSCRCEAGWKGRECSTRIDECEVADCNGNGQCIEGQCQCRTGFKGEHCELADCFDPQCTEHGVCFEGVCICKAGWSGSNCSLPDTKLHRFLPNCSSNGVYDYETGKCICYSHYSGADCSKFACSLECGTHGHCQDGRCECEDGWTGPQCNQRQCDTRCLEHGKCVNGTCYCEDGWVGKYCTLDGCPNLCSKHGHCVSSPTSSKGHNLSYTLGTGPQWSCRCDDGWGGRDCSAPQETNCNDEIDNDNDGLVDCADSECCRHEQCHQSLMCITSPDPLDILLRKQPPSPISSFFQKVHFLIEDGSVQSYAQKDTYSEKRVSVIRGQVVSKEFNGLIGVRVSVATDPQFGFTLTRSDGWFDIMVNGGGIVTLQFQRNPFYPIKKSVYVAWNDIGVIQNPIIMYSVPDNGNDFLNFLNHRASSFSFHSQFSLMNLGEINWSTRKNTNSSVGALCAKHDYEQLKPVVHDASGDNMWLTRNTGVMCGDGSCIIAETRTMYERVSIGTTQLKLVYQSSLAQGYMSTLRLQLTPSSIPSSLRFVLVRILIEGTVHEKIFEADPDLKYTFAWNKRNVYKQKVYGFVSAKVYVGYLYHGCPNVIWSAFHTKVHGYDMEISELGAWNLDIHHRYNVYDSLFQRGDGQIVYFAEGRQPLPLSIESIAGIHLQPRPFSCALAVNGECGPALSSARFFSLVTLTSAPDGSVFVGDANLIRRITPDARIYTVYHFKSHSNRQSYEYYIAFNSLDGYLYISDPDKLQILRIQISEKYDSHHHQDTSLPDVEVVIGTGERCLPHDRNMCGDGKTAAEIQLTYPKGLAFGVDGSLFFADGNVIRVLDTAGYVHRIVGEWNKRQWKPASCKTTQPANEIKLHWPTSLAVNPVDGSLHFVDNYVIFKLNHEMHVSIVAGLPSFCLEEAVNSRPSMTELNCQGHRLDPRMFSYCGQDILFGAITFTPSGVLYATDISRQSENRIFIVHTDGSLVHMAGFKWHNGGQHTPNCSVERCSDISGHNCTCLIADSAPKAEPISVLTDRTMGVKAKLFSVSALTATGDGTVYVADEGSLRLYRLRTYSPQVDDQLEIKILSPNLGEMYTFNQHGQHMSTRSTVTGRTLFTFHYSQDNSFGKLTDVVDVAGNKISFMRDPSGALHTIESSYGFKCYTTVNKLGLLEQIGTHFNNGTLTFDYYPNGLLRSKVESSTGQTHVYLYDTEGRVSGYLQPSGTFIEVSQQYSDENRGDIFDVHEAELFDEESTTGKTNTSGTSYLSKRDFELSIDDNWQMSLKHSDQSIGMQLLADGSILMNTSRNVNAYFGGKASKLSQAMLPMQAQMFPLISRCRVEYNLGNNREQNSNQQQTLDLSVEYDLKMKSSMISSVEKFVAVNNSLTLKLEYDWKANREIYYNQSQRPILFMQFDENGRPIQWVPNTVKDRWLPHSMTFDKAGHLASWQDGVRTHNYARDRAGRLIEVRQSDHFTRYSYSTDAEHGHSLQLPSSITLRSGHKYSYEHDSSGRLRAIITPKSARHEFDIKIVLGYYRLAYCPPIFETKSQPHSTSHCYLFYYNSEKQLNRPLIKTFPYDHGKIVYRYGSRQSLSKEFGKDYHRSHSEDNLLADQVIFGGGLVERWFDRKSGNDLRGIWRSGNIEFSNVFKYTRNTGLIKHQLYQFGNIASISQLTYNYRYDNAHRLRAIQSKLGTINLPTQEFSYTAKGQLETMGNFRYFERNQNETLVGDGVALFVRRYDAPRSRLRYASVTIADKEVFRVDYMYDSLGLLTQTRTFLRHLGANKMRMQNFTYDLDGQLVEVQGREHWRFVYDFNGNLVTFLYLGNRIDIEYDSADRVRNFGKGQDGSPQSGSSPYITDLRGFVVQRGDEHLSYNILGQLLTAKRPNRYEVHYIYDYQGRLVVRQDHQNNVTQYFYGNPRKPHLLTHAFNNADGKVLSFVYDDHDDSLIMLRVNNENFYVATDQTKSPLLVLDHRGQVIKEVHRSPYGHVLFDSNPGFYLPVDFQGGIPDPLTNLVHFVNGRVYDTLTGRWLTPQIEQMFVRNLMENPRPIHQYQFGANDPINVVSDHHTSGNVFSPAEAQSVLRSQTESLIDHDTNFGHLRLLTQFKLTSAESFPVRSHFFSSLQFIIDQLGQIASFKTNYFDTLTLQDWTSAQSMWNFISMENGLFGNSGILITKSKPQSSSVQVHGSARTDGSLRDFLQLLFNGSHLVDTHLLMGGEDHFYLVREQIPDGKSLAQLSKYQHLVNYTVHPGQSETDKKPLIDVRVSLPTLVMNVRFGTTLNKERERVLRLAKKYAVGARLFQERANLMQSRTPSHAWNEEERQYILSTPERQQTSNALRIDYYHPPSACPMLADDGTNVVLRSKRH